MASMAIFVFLLLFVLGIVLFIMAFRAVVISVGLTITLAILAFLIIAIGVGVVDRVIDFHKQTYETMDNFFKSGAFKEEKNNANAEENK